MDECVMNEIKFNYCKPSLLLGYYAERNSILFYIEK